MAGQVVNIRRETLAACMTCPLCDKLLRDATTISLCLHTFCRKCIYDKLSDEEVDTCPVCDIDLGCVPTEKLRPDHNLQDIRAKLFPFRRRKTSTPESMPSNSLPVKRKERSLSSLVVSTPKVSSRTGFTGKRAKSIARKCASARGSSFSMEDTPKKEHPSVDYPKRSSSPETLNKIIPDKKQSASPTKTFNDRLHNKDKENGTGGWEGNVDLWKPLNCLVEAANRSKFSKLSSQDSSNGKSERANGPDYEEPKFKVKEHQAKSKTHVDKNGKSPLPGLAKRKRLSGVARKVIAGGTFASAQAILDAQVDRQIKRNYPIWLSLVASEDQEGGNPLPQISGCYLRIKDGNLPVSFVQKYLVKKFDLASESEVEISCQGQPVLPTVQLQSLVDFWLQTASTSKRIPVTIGSSAKDFVMVLTYSRRVIPP